MSRVPYIASPVLVSYCVCGSSPLAMNGTCTCILAVCIDSSGSWWLELWRVESSQRGTRVSASRIKSINASTHSSIQRAIVSKNIHYIAFTFRTQSRQMLLLSKLSAFLMKADKNVRLDSARFWLDSSVHVTKFAILSDNMSLPTQ